MSVWRDINDSATRHRIFYMRQKQHRKEKMTKVIRLKLHFKIVLGFLEWAHHDTGVVDKNVNIRLSFD